MAYAARVTFLSDTTPAGFVDSGRWNAREGGMLCDRSKKGSRHDQSVWKWFKSCVRTGSFWDIANIGEDGAYGNQSDRLEDVALALDKRLSFISEDKRGASVVELVKKEGTTLGLIIAGGVDKGSRPKIANLRPGSIAHRCDALAVGDYIISVNGIRTNKLKHDEIVNLLKNAGDKVVLEVEYEIPNSTAEASMCVCPKIIQVKLEKENGSFGFVIRGGACSDRLKSRPLTITHVRPGGPTDREGTIKSGDRLFALDNINLSNATLCEGMDILKQADKSALFTVEYDVSVMDAVRHASGALLVEIDKTPGSQLGITLTQVPRAADGAIVIESIKQASVAERCGALHVGDQVLAIDGTRIDQMSPAEAMQLLKISIGEVIKLEILPISQMALRKLPDSHGKRGAMSPPMQSYPSSNYNTLSSIGGHSTTSSTRYPLPPIPPHHVPCSPSPRRSQRCYKKHHSEYIPSSSNASLTSSFGIQPSGQLSHTEITEVLICADHRGFGFALQGATFTTELLSAPPIISNIDPRGPVEKTGVLQVGDRVLSVNGHSTEGMTVEDVTRLIQQSRPRVILEVEFDVAESVVPSSGTFTVKLAKRGPGLGITITSPKNRRQGEPLLISDIKKGSVAHRTGTLQPGDKLLAIDSIRMDNCTIEDAAQILQSCDEIVKLRIRKDEAFSEEPDASGAVIYTVELARHGGPLGITITGTEEPFDPIIISGLTEGGLAERTGALHVGDRILAINGHSLRGKPLSEAILMLQNSGDVVTLKISKSPVDQSMDPSKIERPKEPEPSNYLSMLATPLPSVDSAVESWDSYAGLEGNSGSSHTKTVPTDGSGESDPSPSNNTQTSETCHASKPVEEPNTVQTSNWKTEPWEHGNHNPANFPSNHSTLSDNDPADWTKVLEDLETCGQSKLLRQIERSIMGSEPSLTLNQIPNSSIQYDDIYGFQSRTVSDDNSTECEFPIMTELRQKCGPASTAYPYQEQTQYEDGLPSFHGPLAVPIPIEVHRVTLFKDKVYEDFGFSVSDGLYERGVYVNRIRPGGPADLSGILKSYDRILQVNTTKTHNFDCCLTVPLIAAAGDSIELIVSRPAYFLPGTLDGSTLSRGSSFHPWIDDADREDCSSPHALNRNSQVLTKTL